MNMTLKTLPPLLFWANHRSSPSAWISPIPQPVYVTAVYYLFSVPPGHSQKTTAPWWPQPTPASAPPRESWSTARQPNSAWRRYQVEHRHTCCGLCICDISLCGCVGVWMCVCLCTLTFVSCDLDRTMFNLHLLLSICLPRVDQQCWSTCERTMYLPSLGNRSIGSADIKMVVLHYGLAALPNIRVGAGFRLCFSANGR